MSEQHSHTHLSNEGTEAVEQTFSGKQIIAEEGTTSDKQDSCFSRFLNTEFAQRWWPLLVKFVRFGIVGFSGMIVDYGVLFLGRDVFGLHELLANAISFTAAAISNYFLNRIWTFKSKEEKVAQEFSKFFLVSLIGLGISTLTLYLFGRALPDWNADWRFYILKFFAIVITTLWNFFGNLFFTFKQSHSNA